MPYFWAVGCPKLPPAEVGREKTSHFDFSAIERRPYYISGIARPGSEGVARKIMRHPSFLGSGGQALFCSKPGRFRCRGARLGARRARPILRRPVQASGKRDLLIIQGIMALDDLDKTVNLFANRLREWYGLHFPELGSLIEKNDVYLKLIISLGERGNFDAESLVKEGLMSDRTEVISDAAKRSMGAIISDRDMTAIVMKRFILALLPFLSCNHRWLFSHDIAVPSSIMGYRRGIGWWW
jgi:hypothetical protein